MDNPFELEISAIEQELLYRTLREDYFTYVKYANPEYVESTLHKYLCNIIQTFIEKKTPSAAFDVLLLSIPPQCGKSLTITETLPSWYLGKHPNHDVIIASYNEDTAQRFGRRNKEKLEIYSGNVFPEYIPKASPWSNTEFESTRKGRCLSRGIMSGITGNPAHLFIIDDPIKNRQEADSPTTRNAILMEYYNSIRTRIKPRGKLILIQTRWHEEDLYGTLSTIVPTPRLTKINIPCECVDSINDPLKRQLGDSICPEIGRGNSWLKEFKAEYADKEGRRAWSALYQGTPSTDEGNIIPVQDFRYYDTPPSVIPYVLISVDAAFKAEEENDYVVAQVWGKIDNKYYLLDQKRDHFTFMDTLKEIRELRVSHPDTLLVLIEDKANGSAVINVLSDEMEGIVPVEPSGGKVSRAHAITPAIESGRVFLPRHASFTNEFLAECKQFPNGAHDDMVDSMTQALHHMIYVDADVVNKLKIKYRKWTKDMFEDFDHADDALQIQLLELWGYPEEWREENEEEN